MCKRIIKTVLSVLLFLSLVVVSFLTIIRGIFIEEASAAIDKESIEQVKSELNSENVHQVLDKFLNDYEIPTGVIDKAIENNEHQEIIKEYTEKFITTALNGEELPSIPVEKIETLLNKGIEKYNEAFGTDISIDKIKNMVEEFAEKVSDFLKVIHSNLQILQKLQIILDNTLYYSVLALAAILILILAIWLKREALFSLGGISIFNGMVLLITFAILKMKDIEPILNILPKSAKEIQNSFLISGSAFTIVGILLLIMYRILLYRQQKKERVKTPA